MIESLKHKNVYFDFKNNPLGPIDHFWNKNTIEKNVQMKIKPQLIYYLDSELPFLVEISKTCIKNKDENYPFQQAKQETFMWNDKPDSQEDFFYSPEEFPGAGIKSDLSETDIKNDFSSSAIKNEFTD